MRKDTEPHRFFSATFRTRNIGDANGASPTLRFSIDVPDGDSKNRENDLRPTEPSPLANQNETERLRLTKEWRDAPRIITHHPPVLDKDGNLLFPKARELTILGHQVMRDCEAPWARDTVEHAFEGMRFDRQNPPRILERGWGLGITSSFILQKLIGIGKGTYDIIELNRQVAGDAKKWARSAIEDIRKMTGQIPAAEPEIEIVVHEGDAYEITRQLAIQSRQFDIILSDTFPLSKEEAGINDIKDAEHIKQCLSPDGRFTFFAYYPGSPGFLAQRQLDILNRHFKKIHVHQVDIDPPPDYKYLQGIKTLPVVICEKPILNDPHPNVTG